MIFQRSADVPVWDSYKAYRPILRRDFDYQCAYCRRHEFFFGGGEAGEIDHFRPRHLFPLLINSYSNLYWSCRKCNAFKSGTWPSASQLGRELRFLDPCADNQADHWRMNADGTLTALTLTGRYTVEHICLNRPTLVEFRSLIFGLQLRVKAIKAALGNAHLSPILRASLQAEMKAAEMLLYPPVFSI